MQLLVFLLTCYGMTHVVTLSKLFAPIREVLLKRFPKTLGYWVKCQLCFGLWAGLGWALVGLWPPTGIYRPLDLLAAGCISSGFCWMMRVVLYRLGEGEL